MMLKLCMKNNDSCAACKNTESRAAHENTDLQAAHEFLARVLLTSMQHTNYGSHAAHTIDSHALHKFLLVSSTFHVTCEF